MAGPPQLSREQARRVAVRAQLLDAYRAESLVEVVSHLTLLQIDPTKAIAPSADLVAWSRLGGDYAPSDLRFALEEERSLVEYDGAVRPMADMGLFLADASAWPPWERTRSWIEENEPFRLDILARLEAEGALVAGEIPDTSVVPWRSTGWTDDRNVQQMLEMLWRRGEVAVAGRRGRHRVWDLASRVYPPDLEVPSPTDALRIRAERRLTALGIARPKTTAVPGEPNDVGAVGVECTVEGTAGIWRVDPDGLATLDDGLAGRTALLSPYDRLVYDRDRALGLFDFEYVLEMYKPVAKRRWGYFALPVLNGDRLVGKLDAKADHRAGVLRVYAVHEDVSFAPEIADAVDAEIEELAEWLGLDVSR